MEIDRPTTDRQINRQIGGQLDRWTDYIYIYIYIYASYFVYTYIYIQLDKSIDR